MFKKYWHSFLPSLVIDLKIFISGTNSNEYILGDPVSVENGTDSG